MRAIRARHIVQQYSRKLLWITRFTKNAVQLSEPSLWGEFVAISQRGIFVRNPSIIHNSATKTVLKKPPYAAIDRSGAPNGLSASLPPHEHHDTDR